MFLFEKWKEKNTRKWKESSKHKHPEQMTKRDENESKTSIDTMVWISRVNDTSKFFDCTRFEEKYLR